MIAHGRCQRYELPIIIPNPIFNDCGIAHLAFVNLEYGIGTCLNELFGAILWPKMSMIYATFFAISALC